MPQSQLNSLTMSCAVEVLVFRGLCSERERLTRVVLGKVPAAAMG